MSRTLSGCLRALPVVFVLVACQLGMAQGPSVDAPSPSSEFVSVPTPAPRHEGSHKFFDKQNVALFAATAALSGADFAVTRANLQSGGQELNPVVRVFGRSSSGLAVNFAAETASVVAISYFFHKTNHHRLERLVSIVDSSASAGAVAYGLTHR